MSRYSYGEMVEKQRSERAFREDYFDARTAAAGARVPYRNEEDETGDAEWHDAIRVLARRDLELHDTGSGYVIRATT